MKRQRQGELFWIKKVFRSFHSSAVWRLGALAAIALSSWRCTEPPPLSLSAEDRSLIDTLYEQEISVFRPRLDSFCEQFTNERLSLAVDSIIRLRRVEEIKLRQRILQQLQEQ
jgi:hypothetical protein